MAEFVDRVVLQVSGGHGGNGCVSVRREKFKPLAGPNGGNGGNGGDVILQVDPQVTTLLNFHHNPHQHASNGDIGRGDMHHGQKGQSLLLKVPQGTVVKDSQGQVLADLLDPGASYLAARGGQGGLGNAALASPKRKAPGFALLGTAGQERELVLELKSIADIALVGYPSAGKSSLIAALSAARPKIAAYPFTTLTPHLGVVEAGQVRYTVADVPGLIEGASQGKGLGQRFLRHVERSSALVHVIDCATLEPGRDPVSDYRVIQKELQNYSVDPSAGVVTPLHERPQLVVLNKIDVPEALELAEFVREEFEKMGLAVYLISTVSHRGLKELTFAMAALVEQDRQQQAKLARVQENPVIHPPALKSGKKKVEFTIRKEEHNLQPLYRILGEKPEKWVQQTDFNNDEAVGYLADRFARLGIEEQLFKVGAKAGQAVVIGQAQDAVVFDWEPTMVTGAEVLSSPRGTDSRLEELIRPTRAERKAHYHERMDAKAEARAELEAERQAGIWTESLERKKTGPKDQQPHE